MRAELRFGQTWAVIGLGMWLYATAGAAQAPPRNSQVQVTRQFLRAVLRGEYTAAYVRLAPEIRKSVTPARFRTLVRSLAVRGQRRGAGIELYKMGVRLDDSNRGTGRLFVAYAWAADSASARRMPPEWLEVTFRDTTSRQVLGFRLRHR